jgi:hypothetical protein
MDVYVEESDNCITKEGFVPEEVEEGIDVEEGKEG